MKIVRKWPWPGIVASCLLLMGLAVVTPEARAQDDATTTGTVASTSRNTLTVRTDSGQYQLFVIDRDTRKPADLPIGSGVRVSSSSGDEPGVRLATQISALGAPATNQSATDTGTVPPVVRRIERDIERQARRLQLGVRAGVGLDPELVLLGLQMQVGPFFNQQVYFRPNIEFGFGEVTTLFAINPEFVYRLPVSSRVARWSTYVGAGPGFNFIHQNFDRTDGSGNRIDFGDFRSDVGLNILGGIRYRSGMFTEIKTSVYSGPSPTLRLIVGYNF